MPFGISSKQGSFFFYFKPIYIKKNILLSLPFSLFHFPLHYVFIFVLLISGICHSSSQISEKHSVKQARNLNSAAEKLLQLQQ